MFFAVVSCWRSSEGPALRVKLLCTRFLSESFVVGELGAALSCARGRWKLLRGSALQRYVAGRLCTVSSVRYPPPRRPKSAARSDFRSGYEFCADVFAVRYVSAVRQTRGRPWAGSSGIRVHRHAPTKPPTLAHTASAPLTHRAPPRRSAPLRTKKRRRALAPAPPLFRARSPPLRMYVPFDHRS